MRNEKIRDLIHTLGPFTNSMGTLMFEGLVRRVSQCVATDAYSPTKYLFRNYITPEIKIRVGIV